MNVKQFYPDQKRLDEKLLNSLKLFSDKTIQEKHDLCLFLSSTDVGVMRNLGRNGTKFSPTCLLNQLSLMQKHKNASVVYFEVSNEKQEWQNFDLAQEQEAQKIKEIWQKCKASSYLHLGGGHDHIYPFLNAIELSGQYDNIVVLNLDAHCDTRQSDHNHSGTPFRQFAKQTKMAFKLYQYGIHDFANSKSTLENIEMEILTLQDAWKLTDGLSKLPLKWLTQITTHFTEKTFFILSLDSDAVSSDIMEGVSAVNHQGLPLQHIREFFHWYKELLVEKGAGIYEYNPVYDPSTKGARALASLIYDFLK